MQFVKQLPPLMQLLYGATTLRVTSNYTAARRKALKSRQRANFIDLEPRTMHQRQYFRKFRVFGISMSCKTLAWLRITFSFCNVESWYFQEIKFKHIAAAWFQNFSDYHWFRQRKPGPKVKHSHIVQLHFIEQIHPLMQLLFGVTTLRVMSLQ